MDRVYGDLIQVGYWKSASEPELPDPRELVDPGWSESVKDRVVAYLDAGRVYERWRGSSECRFGCGRNGSACLTDDTYVWPAGLAHYVEEHEVPLPTDFMEHILGFPV